MLIKYKYISLNINTDFFDRTKQPILFLHGFSGSSNDWKGIFPHLHKDFTPLALDFIGHGKSSSPHKETDYTIPEIINQINFVLRYFKLKDPVLAGYSMGGRAALAFTVSNTNIPKALILESSTPGIENPADKSIRVDSDYDLSRNIISLGIDWFTEYWMNLPLFESQKKISPRVLERIKKEKLMQNPVGLSNLLKGFSTGKMPSMWNNLKSVRQKTLLVTGELDTKFTEINSKFVKYKLNSEHKIIKNAGHNTHLEKPAEFTILVNNFLKSL